MKKLLEQKRVEKKIGFDNYTQKDVGNKKCIREPYINYFRNKFRENRKKNGMYFMQGIPTSSKSEYSVNSAMIGQS